MSTLFQNLKFLVMGKLASGLLQDHLKQSINQAGGTITNNIFDTDYICVDTVPASKRKEVDAYVARGGVLVTSKWVQESIAADKMKDATMCAPAVVKRKRKAIESESSAEKKQKTEESIASSDVLQAITSAAQPLVRPSATPADDVIVDLDPVYSTTYSSESHVVVDKDIWDCTLHLSDIGANQNKFYCIQLIDDDETYVLFTRWGRTGLTGQHQVETFADVSAGKAAFLKRFKDKTKIAWAERHSQTPREAKKYLFIDVSVFCLS